jgi:K(+)-stimulated pyrophosphate-energized sodium pump
MKKLLLAIFFILTGGALSSIFAQSGDIASFTPGLWWIAPIGSITALIFALLFYKKMMTADEGTATMKEIASHVREGAMAYLFKQYSLVGIAFAILFAILFLLAIFKIQNPFVPFAFLTGGFFSGLTGFLGMKTATNASARTAHACSKNLNGGLQVAFKSGAVMGLIVVGFGLLDISLWYIILDKLVYTAANMQNGLSFLGMEIVHAGCTLEQKITHITITMLTFGMGASTQALFARVGGGIFTKAADVGADLVGKVEAGIPEDDPRNPATIADNVGDNVGDVAGMGADLYESYCGSILATAAIGASLGIQKGNIAEAIGFTTAPMIIAGIGIILSIIGIFLVRTKDDATQKDLLNSLLFGTLGSSVLILAAAAVLSFTGIISWGIFGAIVAGLIAGVIIGQSTEYFTSDHFTPTKNIAKEAEMGAANVIIDGLATGMYSAGIPVIVISFGIIFAFAFSGGFGKEVFSFTQGLYGIGFAAVGMLSTLGITLATDAYGPIADNAGGNAEMSGLDPKVRERTDALDSLGNTTAATGKGFAIGSAALTALSLLAAYMEEVKMWMLNFSNGESYAVGTKVIYAKEIAEAQIVDLVEFFNGHIMNPLLIIGLFIGGMSAFVFSAMTMKAVGRAAGAMVDEVRSQFKNKPGIMDGTEKPDYAKCVSISTEGAQKEMILPSVLAITVPIVTGLILGVPGVLGLLSGCLITAFVLATMLNNAGGAWDNAKKFIEAGNYGGKVLEDGTKNPAHTAAVIGDTVGDPCKDTSGPSLNILIKLMSMVSIVFTPVIVKFSPMIQKLLGIVLN